MYVYIEKERSEKYLTKMESNKSLEKNIHYIMSVVGGFLGAYALLNRCETFGSSQTSNMIYLVMNILGRNREDVLFRIIAVVIYMGAISLTVIVPKYYKNINTKMMSIVLDIIAVAVIGFFPKNMNYVVALYPIFFVMAVQWNVFKGFNGWVSATIFSTNNLRQAAISITEFLTEKDKAHFERAKFYLGVILSYHIGVVISYIGYKMFAIKGAWLCFIPLTLAFFMVESEEKNLKVSMTNYKSQKRAS